MFRLFFIFFILSSSQLRAQNLVPNNSFEDTACYSTIGAPTHFGASGWFNPNEATPDYYGTEAINNCIGSIYNPTWQSTGEWQFPKSGVRMIGLFAAMEGGCSRDYVEVELSDSLILNTTYCVSFYVSLCNRCQLSTDGFGVYFSNEELLNPEGSCEFEVLPQVANPSGNLLSDTLNWIEVSGSYQALGGEKFLTIGNFFDDSACTIAEVDGTKEGFNLAYYFVDDVSVIQCDSVNIMKVNDHGSFRFYPNPVVDKLTVNTLEPGKLIVKDIFGKVLYDCVTTGSSSEIEVSHIESGNYFLYFESESGIRIVEKFIKL